MSDWITNYKLDNGYVKCKQIYKQTFIIETMETQVFITENK